MIPHCCPQRPMQEIITCRGYACCRKQRLLPFLVCQHLDISHWLFTDIHSSHTEISMRHYNNISWPVHIHHLMGGSHQTRNFLTFFRKYLFFLLKLLSSSGSRQSKDMLRSKGQILQDLCNAHSVMTGECLGNHVLVLS